MNDTFLKYLVIGLIGVVIYLLIFDSNPVIVDQNEDKLIELTNTNEELKDSLEVLKTRVEIIKEKDTIYVDKYIIQKEITDKAYIDKDTVLIIESQVEEIGILHSRVELKDLIIGQQDSIIVLQEKSFMTLEERNEILTENNEYLKKQIKKEKRKRILTTIGGGVILVLVIVASI